MAHIANVRNECGPLVFNLAATVNFSQYKQHPLHGWVQLQVPSRRKASTTSFIIRASQSLHGVMGNVMGGTIEGSNGSSHKQHHSTSDMYKLIRLIITRRVFIIGHVTDYFATRDKTLLFLATLLGTVPEGGIVFRSM